MKMRIHFLAVLMATVVVAAGCGASAKYETAASAPMAAVEEAAVEEFYAADNMAMETGSGVSANTDISDTANVGRKLIRTVELNIQTKEFDEVLNEVQSKVKQLGGYIESSSLDSGSQFYSHYNRYGNLTVRIPSDQLDGFIANVKESTNVTYISESTEDITLRYVDVESRKIALETERDRLLELLEKAETVEDIITIEGRLSEVRYQLESYTSQLRTFDNQVDYSTVHISISEVERETKVEPKTFWEEVVEEFGDSLHDMKRSARNFAIWFLGYSPYLILWAVVIGAAVVAIRVFVKKKKWKTSLKTMNLEKDEETKE